MIFKRGKAACSLVFIFFLFFVGRLTAQMNPIYRFKKVPIPVDLHIEDSILPKGTYDLQFLRANPLSYFLMIMKNGKILHLIQGKEFPYDNLSTIPKKPTLKMSKNKAEKSLIIVFESGYLTKIYPKLRASYRLEYKED
ncbi:hypothetical protein D4R89_08085 [bacterium]|nr:MAG: hypothetical protein D4R89_08085 [bacterium]